MTTDTLSLDRDADVGYRTILGVAVLGVAITFANAPSLPLDFTPFLERLRADDVRRLFGVGIALQSAAGVWLALSLILDVRRGVRAALLVWLTALALCLAPVPTLLEDLVAAMAPAAAVLLVTLLGWALAGSLREPVA